MRTKLLVTIATLFTLTVIVWASARTAEATCYQNFVRVECPAGTIAPALIPEIPESKVTNLTTDLAGKVGTSVLTSYETTAAHAADLSGLSSIYVPWSNVEGTGTDTSTSSSKLVNAADPRMADQRAPMDGSVTEAKLALSDVTSRNVSTATHGLAPKCPGGGTTYWRDDCTWATPPGGGSGSFSTIYSVDFTTLSAANLLTGGDGNKTIDGKTWILANSAKAQAVALNDGTHAGLYVRCSTANSNNYLTTMDAPALYVPLENLSSSLGSRNWREMRAWFMYSTPHTPNANYETAFLGFLSYTTYAPASLNRIAYYKQYNGAVFNTMNAGMGGAAEYYGPGTTVGDVVMLRVLAGDTIEVYVGSSSGGAFPAASTLNWTGRSKRFTQAIDFNSLALWFSVQTSNTAGNADALLAKMYVETM